MAASRGRLSEARLRAKALAKVDTDGSTTAGLSDGLRRKALAAWEAGNKAEARPLYQLVAELDPNDHEARHRSEAEPEPAPHPVVGSSPAPPPAPPPPNKKRTTPADAEPREAPRDEAGARAAVRAGQEALAATRLADAEAAFQHAIQLNPLDAAAIGGLGEVAFERARYAEALDYARRAVKLSPKSPTYLVLVGDSYFKLVRYAEAQAAYEKARALAPRNEVVESRLLSLRGKLRNDR
jgi:tetratricopeptide (TPR) repeat protein